MPHFLFDRLIPGKRATETWSGFVLFGGAYSPQWYDQHVLALPPASLFSPINEWWKVTHETAHGIFFTLLVPSKLDPAIYSYIRSADINNELSATHVIGEQFANWFDWKYAFHHDTALYLNLVWRSWIQLPLVWQSKPQYLARTFAILLCEDLASLADAAGQPRDVGVMPLVKSKWDTFVNMTQAVPDMAEFLIQLKDETEEVFQMVCSLLPLLRWFEHKFEKACGVEGLGERLAPSYGKLDNHLAQLQSGEVILDGIVDPIQLHLRLVETLGDQAPSLPTEVAYIYSMQNCYAQQRRESKC